RRILLRGAGQPLRQRRLFGRTTENHAGGDHAPGVRRVFAGLSEGADRLESSRRFRADFGWRVFHFSEMVEHDPEKRVPVFGQHHSQLKDRTFGGDIMANHRIDAAPETVHWGYFDAKLAPLLTVA